MQFNFEGIYTGVKGVGFGGSVDVLITADASTAGHSGEAVVVGDGGWGG